MFDLKTEILIRQAEREARAVEERRLLPIYVARVEARRSGEERAAGDPAGRTRGSPRGAGGKLLATLGAWLGQREGTIAAS
jgi:hypothetical protein